MHSKTLGAFLDQSEGTNSLMPQAKRLLELRQILLEALPGRLPLHCSVANWRRGRLVIFAENSAIAAKLKLLCPTLSDHYLKRGIEVTAIEIQVQPRPPAPARPAKRAALSEAGADSLARFARQLPDSELKTVMTALARRRPKGAR
ncbi:MAG: DUF721 domain-containing protein [Betaproteobacteria bacterium]|nr:DUF721 domain-containing protein [Betaproteobacteria bacterium]